MDACWLIELIVGVAPVVAAAPTTPAPSDRAIGATITGLSGAVVRDVLFAIGTGEVVGLTGLVGLGHRRDSLPHLWRGPGSARTVTLGGSSTSST